MENRKVVIIGGVAGGASCAARARRLSEHSEIVVLERGPYISFANCGLPYHIGGEIADREKLILRTPEQLQKTFNIDVRVNSEAISIDRERKCVTVRNREGDYEESYDVLVLAPGAAPLAPPIPGLKAPGHFTLRTIPDTDAIIEWVRVNKSKKALVVGGGYIGLEMAEQLKERGLAVTLVELASQVMAPLDPEMAEHLHKEMRNQGVELLLGKKVVGFEKSGAGSVASLESGETIDADVVILGLGVRPENELAKAAGLELGGRGGIATDDRMRTSDPDIYAVGDAVETLFQPTGKKGLVPLAGPANRQGRTAADNIFGIDSRFDGVIGTAILRLFGLNAACTGANEKLLKAEGMNYEALHLHPAHHVGYYPGAKPMAIKLLFEPENGKVLGAQIVGTEGVDKRIDVIATALKLGATVDDLAELELAYAPPFNGAKDPVNLAGMAAQNVVRGLAAVAQWSEIPPEGLPADDPRLVLDVREAKEREASAIPGSLHIPLGELRSRLSEIPKEREIIVHCASGQRSNNAMRALMQHGYRVRNLTGSMKTWLGARSQ